MEPWLTKETARDEYFSVMTDESRVDRSRVEGNLSVIEAKIVVGEKGREIRTFGDRMVLALSRETVSWG